MNKISLRRCNKYDTAEIIPVLRQSLEDLQFDPSAVKDKRVLLKPNMLGAFPPEAHVTTHPAFVEACAMLFKEHGAQVIVGDSSNGIYPVDEVWNVTGIRRAAELAGAEIAPFEKSGSVDKNGIRLAKASLNADIMVNLPKFKTHGLTYLTLAVKNLFGCIPGMIKTDCHRNNIDRRDFARLLVRVSETLKPELTIMDAITGMHGNGPSGGNPIDMGLIISGRNIHSLDAVCCKLVNINPSDLDTLCHAEKLGVFDPNAKIDIIGEHLDSLSFKNFEMPSTFVGKKLDWGISKLTLSLFWRHMNARPQIDPSRCQRCGLCLKSCPVGAIGWKGKDTGSAPKIDNDICIQCFCCHEVCPYQAIDIKRSALAKLNQKLDQWIGRRRVKQ